MSILELVIISFGLASDTFAVSLCKGVLIKKNVLRNCLFISLCFAFVQSFMPFIGYVLGNTFSSYVSKVDHWVAFIILFLIGSSMIYETYIGEERDIDENISFSSLLLPAFATSIDAFALGITFSFFEMNIFCSIFIIGIVTFCLAYIGLIIGYLFGKKFESLSKLLGGFILVIMGIKILLEHI